MPNFKIFQDNPDQALIKIYGTDNTDTAQPLLTSASGTLSMSGVVGVSGNVGVSGSVTAGISGSVAVSGPIEITSSGTLAVSGPVTVTSGDIRVSGVVTLSGSSVAISGPVEITSSGTLSVSGPVTVTSGDIRVSGVVTLSGSAVQISGHSIVDSGPDSASVTSGGSGEVSGAFDVLSYSSWTLAVEYSGTSGLYVHVLLQKSAVSGGVASGGDWIFDSSGTFASQNWLFMTTGATPRYARLYYTNESSGTGTLYQTFQAQN